MASNTRLATTVAARYMDTVGATDAFYLDGRIKGKREDTIADLTVDRTDRGAFIAVYASTHGSDNPSNGEDGNRQILDTITNDLKKNHRHNIDYEINELAESAVNVAGRLTLSDQGVSQPYFSGIIVKDAEIAAVTLGRGCAYLYRDDAIFALTEDDYPLEPIDSAGRQISNMDDFAAGIAGSIRYSNIAQLKPDDCLIVCNREIMEAVGQRGMLRMLDEAEDQMDAAGMILNEAVRLIPNVPMQIIISFVEEIEPLDRVGRNTLSKGVNVRDTLGKGIPAQTGPVKINKASRNTGALSAAERNEIAAAAVVGATAASGTGVVEAKEEVVTPEVEVIEELTPAQVEAPVTPSTEPVEEPVAQSEPEIPVEPEVEEPVEDAVEAPVAEPVQVTEQTVDSVEDSASDEFSVDTDAQSAPESAETFDSAASNETEDAASFADEFDEADDFSDDWVDADGWSDDDLSYDFKDEFTEVAEPVEADVDDATFADFAQADDSFDETREEEPKSRGKLIAIIVLIIIAVLLIGFIIHSLVKGGKTPATSTESIAPLTTPSTDMISSMSTSAPGETVENITTTTLPTETTTTAPPTTTTAPPTTTTTAAPTTEAPTTTTTAAPKTYTIQAGDSVYAIAQKLYPDANIEQKMLEIAAANGHNYTAASDTINWVLQPGQEIVLP